MKPFSIDPPQFQGLRTFIIYIKGPLSALGQTMESGAGAVEGQRVSSFLRDLDQGQNDTFPFLQEEGRCVLPDDNCRLELLQDES